MLRELVAQGKLPPLVERLPTVPMVLSPVDELGAYCVHLSWVISASSLESHEYQFLLENPYRWRADASRIEPNLAIAYEYAADGMSMTLTFRQGVKWSDGEPFTAEDIDFWWNDLVMNPDNSFNEPYWTITAEKSMQLEVVDDFTVRVMLNEPHWLFRDLMASTSDYMRMYAPKHYLKQYHPKYNDAVTDFSELEQHFTSTGNLYIDPELPVLTPWRTVEYTPGSKLVAERNPYYWKVDTQGRQLPYIDRVVVRQVEDPRVIPLKIVGGEVLDGTGAEARRADVAVKNGKIAALGELVTEKAGVLNLGIEGIMTIGAMSGWMWVYQGGDLVSGVLFAAFVGALFGLLHSLLAG